MTQLMLRPEMLQACPWARPARDRTGVVLAVPLPLPLGLAPWLKAQGWELAGYAEDRGQAAVKLTGGATADILGWLPQPTHAGSRTAGNLLPW